jgi:hypothetical protein
MKRFIGKFGFVHRRLWQQDGGYRVALLLGPAPFLGALLAAAVWGSVLGLRETTYQRPPWATPPTGHKPWTSDADHPQTVEPERPLPQVGADGALVGREPGWNVAVNPIQVSQTMDVDVKVDSLVGFSIKGPSVDMEQILAAGPKASQYVAVGSGFLVIREPGIYALSARFERPSGVAANCLVRLGLGGRRILSTLNVDVVRTISRSYPPAWFDLRPGLYPVGWVFGCWHDNAVIGPARLTILVGHPGETMLSPARPEDVIR